MKDIILVVNTLAALAIIGLVLLQQGRGADVGAAFGSGASQTLFGSRGSANFLSRATAVLAAVFFAGNLVLAWIAAKDPGASAVTQSVTVEQPAEPAKPAPAAPEVPR